MLVLGLPLFAPVLVQAQQTPLLACCRRGGAHHCMTMADAPSAQPVVRMTCPAFPHAGSAVTAGAWAFSPASPSVHRLGAQPGTVGQVEAGFRISFGRARQKRGPPTQNS